MEKEDSKIILPEHVPSPVPEAPPISDRRSAPARPSRDGGSLRFDSLRTARALSQVLVIVLSVFLLGCAALERMSMSPTEPYYLSNTQEQFPPKPREFKVPMLTQAPQHSRPIGIFQFTTQNGRGFATQAAAYNARRVGADAVWIRNVQEWSEPYAYDIPAHWETRHETVHRRRLVKTKGPPGQPDIIHEETFPENIERHTFVPAEHVSGFHRFTSIDAVMYRQR